MDNTSGIVVALSGFKRSGKDTVADLLVKKAEMVKENLGIERILKTSFAEPFKEMARLVLDIREEDIEDKEAPIKYTKRWFGEDLSWRQILIRMGEGMKEVISPSVWTLALENRIYNGLHSCTSGNFLAVIPDVRYSQELKLIHKLRKMHWRVFHYGIFRKEAIPDWWKLGLTPETKEERSIIEKDFGIDHSEYEVLQKNPKLDGAIYNDGSREDLELEVEQILKRIMLSDIKEG